MRRSARLQVRGCGHKAVPATSRRLGKPARLKALCRTATQTAGVLPVRHECLHPTRTPATCAHLGGGWRPYGMMPMPIALRLHCKDHGDCNGHGKQVACAKLLHVQQTLTWLKRFTAVHPDAPRGLGAYTASQIKRFTLRSLMPFSHQQDHCRVPHSGCACIARKTPWRSLSAPSQAGITPVVIVVADMLYICGPRLSAAQQRPHCARLPPSPLRIQHH